MIDTVGFYVPISEKDYETLMTKGILTQRVDKDNGLIEWEYTNFKTSMSWNYRIQWKVDNTHIVRDPGVKNPIEQVGIPYLRLEFSVPKVLYGHNLDSASLDSVERACLLVQHSFEKMTGVDIITPDGWFVYRIDTCANFVMKDAEQVYSYIRYLQRLDYPRRGHSTEMHKNNSLYFSSVHNTFKVYAKGLEFKAHDAERFKNEIERQRLQNKANCILRVEVENKRRLKYIVEKDEEKYSYRIAKFKGWVTLKDLNCIVDWRNEMERVMTKFMVGKETKVMASLEVFNILKHMYSARAARAYFGVYMMLVTQGQAEVKRQIPKPTYYRVLKVLRDNKISVVASDVERNPDFKEESEFECLLGHGFPIDFSLKMSPENKYYQMPLKVAA